MHLASSSSQNSPNKNNKTPSWSEVIKLEKCGEAEGNWWWNYKVCNGEYNSSYDRVKYQLSKISCEGISVCSKVTKVQVEEIRRLAEQVEMGAQQVVPKVVPLPSETHPSSNASMSLMAHSKFVLLGHWSPKREKEGSTPKCFIA